jgi:hypothetical protein
LTYNGTTARNEEGVTLDSFITLDLPLWGSCCRWLVLVGLWALRL